ncbi:FAD-dependent oxidoreductase [Anaerocolumna sp. MB42-C2]|uniref:FAD-dependent oxidoreductase n=1 Tax=Anaerocolumna sp. MB42-C2 TaxID=3070997 RepID=UPI0027E181BA|nr:FAD-dependent oxidoreductase [Anaerocolumna sp. MB42-C2]WMJ85611.1 FAD-dependent oxidoreductase [Anaerocolumna sp. MB42-C2]
MNIQFVREIPENTEYEIIIAGGGPAGCAAAIAAARCRANVLLIEASGSLGGMGTIGLVPAWCPFSDKEKIIYRGIALEIFNKAKAGMRHVKKEDADWVPIDPEALKRVYDEMIMDAGVTVLFHTQVVSVNRQGNKLDYIVTANKGGLTAYKGNIYIDCTGDADIFAGAGLPYDYGDEQNHDIQPSTHCFVLTNVDEYHYHNSPVLHMNNPECAAYDIARSEKYPLITDAHCCHSLIGPRTVGFNAGHLWNVDSRDPIGASKALMQGRQLAYQYHQGLKEYLPETYGASYLAETSLVTGIRESRRIKGEYTITYEDYKNRKAFPDEIGRNCYFLDVHQTKEERDRIMRGERNGEEDFEPYAPGESHGIPYRSLIPKEVDNLIAAGRIISSDHRVQGSIRVMPVCLVTGQAAGTAAVLASQTGDTHKVDIMQLRRILGEAGAYFE